MSLSDGQMRNETLYTTSDIALAAYLLMRGFELLGAVDTGIKRKEFGLTHTEPEVLLHMEVTIKSMADEFDNMEFTIPHDPSSKVNFRVYQQKTKELHRALDEAIRKDR